MHSTTDATLPGPSATGAAVSWNQLIFGIRDSGYISGNKQLLDLSDI
jgi:hypothetical protein